MRDEKEQTVWVFSGRDADFPSAVFTTKERADEWILPRGLVGVLTAYPLDVPVHQWALEQGHLEPDEERDDAAFVQTFSSAHQEHYHYTEDGRVVGG